MFGRRKRLPAQARPPLSRDERVLCWASTADSRSGLTDRDTAVVVTTLGVWLPGRSDRLGWHHIHKATWSGSRLTITPAVVSQERDGYVVMVDGPSITADLPTPGTVPEQVRQRVTRSVAVTEHHGVPGGGVRVVARRTPGVDGVVWNVRYDDATDPDDPEVVAATAKLVSGCAAEQRRILE